jgi:alkylation response protein AidB-like acyl-CoA dehydrogenase
MQIRKVDMVVGRLDTLSQSERDAEALRTARHLAESVLLPAATAIDRTGIYPGDIMHALAEAGLMGIAIPQAEGGLDLSYRAQSELFSILTEGCLAASFILTQHHSCTSLFAASPNKEVRSRWLPSLASGTIHGASGFNFLNLPPEKAPMRAIPVDGGYRLTGSMPWVTAAHESDVIAAGAVLPDLTQIMVAVPLRQALAEGTAGIDPPLDLAALTASDTTIVHFDNLFAPAEDLMLGPDQAVLKATFRGATTYVPTAMTVGHARAALAVLEEIAARKGELPREMADWVRHEADRLAADIDAALAVGDFSQAPGLRGRGNALSVRAAHCVLIAAGGTGYRQEAAAQRLYREAGFFSVWSVGSTVIPETLSHLLTSPL